MDINDANDPPPTQKKLEEERLTNSSLFVGDNGDGTIKFEDNSILPTTLVPNKHLLSQSVEPRVYGNLVNYNARLLRIKTKLKGGY